MSGILRFGEKKAKIIKPPWICRMWHDFISFSSIVQQVVGDEFALNVVTKVHTLRTLDVKKNECLLPSEADMQAYKMLTKRITLNFVCSKFRNYTMSEMDIFKIFFYTIYSLEEIRTLNNDCLIATSSPR